MPLSKAVMPPSAKRPRFIFPSCARLADGARNRSVNLRHNYSAQGSKPVPSTASRFLRSMEAFAPP